MIVCVCVCVCLSLSLSLSLSLCMHIIANLSKQFNWKRRQFEELVKFNQYFIK